MTQKATLRFLASSLKLAVKVKDILGDESFDSNGYIELDTLVCFHANIGHNTYTRNSSQQCIFASDWLLLIMANVDG